jgi:hypothetical protein
MTRERQKQLEGFVLGSGILPFFLVVDQHKLFFSFFVSCLCQAVSAGAGGCRGGRSITAYSLLHSALSSPSFPLWVGPLGFSFGFASRRVHGDHRRLSSKGKQAAQCAEH